MASRALAVLLTLLTASVSAFAQNSPSSAQAPAPVVSQASTQAAQQSPPPATKPGMTAAEQQKEKEKKDKAAADAQTPKFEEQVVVTASKVEQQLVNAPAAVSVITAQTLSSKSAGDYAGLFRAVAGVNVAQTSARDLNITSRGSTSTLSTSQLALIDGRSVYLDFFGFVGWDFLPLNFNEVKQIEVVRGPASAVWGANAMSGVVNIITKSPRELKGTTFTVGGGTFDRTVDGQAADPGAGGSFYSSLSHAGVVNDQWSYKLSLGYVSQDAFPRPAGVIVNTYATGRQPYPSFTNTGTTQPKVDARIDYDFPDGRQRVTVSGGYAGTSGIIHTGIGPFRIEKGAAAGYARADYSRGALKVQFFTNILDGTAPALMSIGTDGQPLVFSFKTNSYDLSLSNISTIGTHHVISYGANGRYSKFDLSIAPGGSDRKEVGAYLQDEMFITPHFRWLVGARLDYFDILSKLVASPRTTFMIKPTEQHTFRLSYNQAYRAPSLTNSYLSTTILQPLDMSAISPTLAGRVYGFPMVAGGNLDLKETALKAYEIGYTGTFANRMQLSFSWYYNDTKNDAYFMADQAYSSTNVPAGWPLPPLYLDLMAQAGQALPSHYTYLNVGRVTVQGIEVGLDAAVAKGLNAFANYSWQDVPKPSGTKPSGAAFTIADINLPPRNRINAGLNFARSRFQGDLSLSYQDKAYWKDVLSPIYVGWTKAFTTVNGSVGAKWMKGKLTTTIKANNILNVAVQQHVFGDVIKRQIVGEARISF
jgi:outer membrane receptor protein involved in Fe transport